MEKPISLSDGIEYRPVSNSKSRQMCRYLMFCCELVAFNDVNSSVDQTISFTQVSRSIYDDTGTLFSSKCVFHCVTLMTKQVNRFRKQYTKWYKRIMTRSLMFKQKRYPCILVGCDIFNKPPDSPRSKRFSGLFLYFGWVYSLNRQLLAACRVPYYTGAQKAVQFRKMEHLINPKFPKVFVENHMENARIIHCSDLSCGNH